MNDKVARYYPRLTRAEDITLLDLLHHVSGYRDYYPLNFVIPRMLEDVDTEKVVTEWASKPLDFEPRARWSYSNTGYLLVGRVIEKISGKPLRDFMKERIFDKLGMSHTELKEGAPPPNAAKGYSSFALGDPEPTTPEGAGWIHAAGGVWSTPTDLLAWDLALADGTLLAPSSHAIMTRPGVLSDGRTTDYGCGLDISRQQHETVLMHMGAVEGYRAFNAIVPRTRSGVAVLTNDSGSGFITIGDGLLKLLVAEEDAATTRIQVAGPPPRDAALELFHQMQANRVDRARLSDDFNAYLTSARLASAAPRLAALGEPKAVEVDSVGERGGLEEAWMTFVFETETIHVSLYRALDGRVEEFLVFR